MKIIVDANMLKSLFEDYRRDDYSYEGCEAILDYYNDFDEDAEIDIIAIACDVNEYGNAIGSTMDEDDLVAKLWRLLTTFVIRSISVCTTRILAAANGQKSDFLMVTTRFTRSLLRRR